VSGNVHEALLVERRKIAGEIEAYTFALDPPAALHFRAGQFVSLRVGEDRDGSAVLRSYSLASSPDQDRLTLVVRLIPGGAAAGWFDRLTIGARVRFTGPMGFFVLELQHTGDVVFGATGVGIAPVLPMLDEVLARPEHGKIHVLWGNRHASDVFWQAELDARAAAHSARLRVRRFLSREATLPAGYEQGRITEPIFALVPDLVQPTFYLVGSGAMIKDVKTGLLARGIDRKRQVRNEAFFD
jgi:ferredoxin-NADP reductase